MPLTVDIHTHILPERWPDLAARYGYGDFIRIEHHAPCRARLLVGDRFFREIEDNCWSPARRLADCDAAGVDVQVLSTVPVMFSYWAKPDDAHDLSRLLNDHIAQVVADHPRRFVGLGTLPMQAPGLAVRELERCVKDLGLAGVEIGTHVGERNLGDPELFEVFAAAEALGAAVFVHPWDMMGKARMPKYWLPWLVGMPAESSLAICSLIFGGVLERLPRLRVAVAHGGGSFFGTFGRVQHGFDVRPDLCAVDNPRPPRDYLGRFWVDALVHDPAALRFIIDKIGVRRVAMGSDYPFPLGEHAPGRLIRGMDHLDGDDKAWLLGKSALAWLDLPADRFAAEGAGDG